MIKSITLLLVFWVNAAGAESNQFRLFFNRLNALSGDFTQTIYSNNNQPIQTTSGTFVFHRPQLKWHTKSPNEQILLRNNEGLWWVDVALEQVTFQPLHNGRDTPLYWLINKPSLTQDVPIFSHQKNGVNYYKTKLDTPKYHALYFGFKGGKLSIVSFKNTLEQTVVIAFGRLRINPEINPQTFESNFDPAFDIIK